MSKTRLMSGRECCYIVLDHLRGDELIGLDLCDVFPDRTVQEGIVHCSTQLEAAYEDYLQNHNDEWWDWAIFQTKCQIP